MMIKSNKKHKIVNIFLSKLILISFFYFILQINFALSSQFSPAIKVNNIFISKYEINERRKLLIALGTSKLEAKKNAQEHLINETLQQLHSKTIGVTVLPSQIEEVFNNFISVRSLTKNSLNQSLRKFGASLDELKKYLKANVLMRNIINNTFYSRMTIEDFDFSIFRPAASISIPTQLNISEIVIPFSVRGKENTIKLGERIIKDLKNGKEFNKLAKRFSKAATSKKGGLIGFVELDSLPDPLRKILVKLKSGKHSNVIITPDSIMIFKINSWKTSQKIQKPPNEIIYAEINNDDSEINNMRDGMWSYLEHTTQNFDIPIKKDNPSTWVEYQKLYPKHSMLLQQYQVGHHQMCWDVRQNPKVVDTFSKIWSTNPEDLLTSFDVFLSKIFLRTEFLKEGY